MADERESDDAFIRQLRLTVQSLAKQLDLSDRPVSTGAALLPASVAAARRLARERRQRSAFLPDVELGEPVWDMLLDLYIAQYEGRLVSVTSLCIAAGVSASTALRWIHHLTEQGVFVRCPDPTDGRRAYISLADAALSNMDRYLEAIAV